MKLVGKSILIISPEPWGINSLSKHHYAEVLASMGNRVFFAHPDNPDETAEGIVLVKDRVKRGIGRLPSFAARKLMASEVRRLKAEHGPFDLVWSFDNSRLFHLDLFEADKSIAQIVDFDMDYQTSVHAKSADLCLGITEAIATRLKAFNGKSYLLGHGYRLPLIDKARPISLEGENTALYIGNLLIKSLNRELVLEVVQGSPGVHFHFVGSTTLDNLNTNLDDDGTQFVKTLASLSNTTLHGSHPSHQLPSFIQAADWCWLAYDTEKFPEQTANSHKILEYLGQGKPVLCTPMKSWEKSELVFKYRSAEEMRDLISRVDLGNEEAKKARIHHATSHSYQERIREIESYIDVS